MQPCSGCCEQEVVTFKSECSQLHECILWLALSMCKYIAFGCTTVLGSASLAVANICTDFEDLVCNHAVDAVKKKL